MSPTNGRAGPSPACPARHAQKGPSGCLGGGGLTRLAGSAYAPSSSGPHMGVGPPSGRRAAIESGLEGVNRGATIRQWVGERSVAESSDVALGRANVCRRRATSGVGRRARQGPARRRQARARDRRHSAACPYAPDARCPRRALGRRPSSRAPRRDAGSTRGGDHRPVRRRAITVGQAASDRVEPSMQPIEWKAVGDDDVAGARGVVHRIHPPGARVACRQNPPTVPPAWSAGGRLGRRAPRAHVRVIRGPACAVHFGARAESALVHPLGQYQRRRAMAIVSSRWRRSLTTWMICVIIHHPVGQ